MPRACRLALWITSFTLLAASLIALVFHLQKTRAGLTWDSADYVGQGLRWANNIRTHERPANDTGRLPMLSLWLTACSLVSGTINITWLAYMGTLPPFVAALGALFWVTRRLAGAPYACMALLLYCASPGAIDQARWVMVETTLSLWVLVALALNARALASPTRCNCFIAGATIGAALMTKLTGATILVWPGVYFLAQALRWQNPNRPRVAAVIAWLAGILLVAGPWYLKYQKIILIHATYAAKFDQLRIAVPDTQFRALRPFHDFSYGFGWIECIVLAAIGIAWLTNRGERPSPSAMRERDLFVHLSSGAIFVHAIALSVPSNYDPRYFVPVIPTIAVLAACLLARTAAGDKYDWRSVFAGTLLVFGCGVATVVRSIRSAEQIAKSIPQWDDSALLLEDLAQNYHVHLIANLGQDQHWNASQLRMFALTKEESSRLEIVEMSTDGSADAWTEIQRRDAVVVLQPTAIDATFLAASPSQNASYWPTLAKLPPPDSVEIPTKGRGWILPDIKVYVKRSLVERGNLR